MSAKSFNHINIKAPADLLKNCRDFYVQVVGLREGARPSFSESGYWLYGDASDALIHMTVSNDRVGGSSYYDHVAFNCDDLAQMRERISECALSFKESLLPDGSKLQIFLHDPCGLRVELNFKL